MSGFKTVKNEAVDEFVEKRSRFICYCKHVISKTEAEDYVNSIKSKHWDAKHNVYAYCIRNEKIKKASDDGEPQGTAGAPMLQKIEGIGVEDVVVVITRYFGGILLGMGGLARAYSYGAELAINACGIIEMKPCFVVKAHMSYDVFGKAEGIMRKFGAVISDCTYTNIVEVNFHIEEQQFDKLEKIIYKISAGESKLLVQNKEFYAIC